MGMSLKNLLSYLLMSLFFAGSFQVAYARVDMDNGPGHGNCEDMARVTSSKAHDHVGGPSHGETHTMHQQHDHEKECADGQCVHSYCMTPAFTAVIISISLPVSEYSHGKILSITPSAIDRFYPSLYRPPRV
jgi:hypothetical protein